MSNLDKRLPRWYFGGLSASCAVIITHPLDLVKVHLQTQKEKKLNLRQMTSTIIKTQGVAALYNGISASMCRQMFYSSTRFAIYDHAKTVINMNNFAVKVAVAAVGGAIGGYAGAPADLINVRMQNDIKLPKDKRRNYKHVFDGLIQVYKNDGAKGLFAGSSSAAIRAAVITGGQLSVYDQAKILLLQTDLFIDNIVLHFAASTISGIVITIITQPLDVLKTRLMNAKVGEFLGLTQCLVYTSKEGFFAFYKGTIPSAVRNIPNTIITFIVYEQLTKRFGYIPIKTS